MEAVAVRVKATLSANLVTERISRYKNRVEPATTQEPLQILKTGLIRKDAL